MHKYKRKHARSTHQGEDRLGAGFLDEVWPEASVERRRAAMAHDAQEALGEPRHRGLGTTRPRRRQRRRRCRRKQWRWRRRSVAAAVRHDLDRRIRTAAVGRTVGRTVGRAVGRCPGMPVLLTAVTRLACGWLALAVGQRERRPDVAFR